MKQILYLSIIVIIFWTLSGCKKNFLDEKPSSSIVIPNTLSDCQKLLDNFNVINITPGLGELACDDHYIYDYSYWQALPSARERNAYIWAKDIYEGEIAVKDWNSPFQQIYYANTVLNQLTSIHIEDNNPNDGNNIKASSLFIRSNAFYNLVSIFAPAFQASTADTDLGIPIRLNPEIDEVEQRASVGETYDRIISDLKESTALFSTTFQNNYRNRPSKSAAFALLARVFLSMRDYDNAGLYADSCLQLYNSLIDYNTISTTSLQPFTVDNAETLYSSLFNVGYSSLLFSTSNVYTVIDSVLYNSYSQNDLRKQIYFRTSNIGTIVMKRGYGGPTFLYPFGGLATDEVYLIKAECLARKGLFTDAIYVLNQLLIKRWKTGTFVPLTAISTQDALNKILTERRKELVFRGLRWTDLRRLNRENANITLTRILNGQTFTLPPNDVRYVFPIPDDEITQSGIQQNVR